MRLVIFEDDTSPSDDAIFTAFPTATVYHTETIARPQQTVRRDPYQEHLRRFLYTECEYAENSFVSSRLLYDAFCDHVGADASRRRFGNGIVQLGHASMVRNGQRVFADLCWRAGYGRVGRGVRPSVRTSPEARLSSLGQRNGDGTGNAPEEMQ